MGRWAMFCEVKDITEWIDCRDSDSPKPKTESGVRLWIIIGVFVIICLLIVTTIIVLFIVRKNGKRKKKSTKSMKGLTGNGLNVYEILIEI